MLHNNNDKSVPAKWHPIPSSSFSRVHEYDTYTHTYIHCEFKKTTPNSCPHLHQILIDTEWHCLVQSQWNEYVFKLILKPRSESQLDFRPKGKLFQTRGAATEKWRLPNIVLQWGRVNSFWDDECRQSSVSCFLMTHRVHIYKPR